MLRVGFGGRGAGAWTCSRMGDSQRQVQWAGACTSRVPRATWTEREERESSAHACRPFVAVALGGVQPTPPEQHTGAQLLEELAAGRLAPLTEEAPRCHVHLI